MPGTKDVHLALDVLQVTETDPPLLPHHISPSN